jgi:NAD-dependent dihydropyrimidine dehydrogenase PreA subunit
MSLPEPFELVVEVAETLLAVLAVCCDCVNGTGDAVIEFALELTNMLLLLTTIDEELCITCVDCELPSDVPVSYAAKYVRLGVSVQKNDTAPSSV